MKMEEAVGQAGSELQAQESMLFAGTAVANGSCTAIVTTTGMRTEMGKIQADITAAAGEDDDTPLKKKLNDFGNLLARVRSPPQCLHVCTPFTSSKRLCVSTGGDTAACVCR